MRAMKINRIRAFAALGGMLLVSAGLADEGFIGGLRPGQRRSDAPVIKEFAPGEAWQARAVHGIAEPRTGLGFLKDQGAWYTPFNRPNLNGRYDLRQMYRQERRDQP